MTCPKCKGKGKRQYIDVYGNPQDIWLECEYCKGKGFLTNDEWRKTCSAEDYAREILTIYNRGYHAGYNDYDKVLCEEDVIEWLKKKHGEWCNL